MIENFTNINITNYNKLSAQNIEHEKTKTYDVENLGPGLGQT